MMGVGFVGLQVGAVILRLSLCKISMNLMNCELYHPLNLCRLWIIQELDVFARMGRNKTLTHRIELVGVFLFLCATASSSSFMEERTRRAYHARTVAS